MIDRLNSIFSNICDSVLLMCSHVPSVSFFSFLFPLGTMFSHQMTVFLSYSKSRERCCMIIFMFLYQSFFLSFFFFFAYGVEWVTVEKERAFATIKYKISDTIFVDHRCHGLNSYRVGFSNQRKQSNLCHCVHGQATHI